MPGAQPAPGLRPHDGLGPGRPLARRAGHDINYIALAGALDHIGRAGQPPTPPLNLVGDFGGGALYLVFGMLCALLERVRSGRGQVVDAAMVDGAASLMTIFHAVQQLGAMNERGHNMLDSGSHFYDVYECADGRYVSIGSVEPQFYAELLSRLGIEDLDPAQQMNGEEWPKLKERFAALFKTKTRQQWCEVFEGSDACFAPVLSIEESRKHPHAAGAPELHQHRGPRAAGAGAAFQPHPPRGPASPRQGGGAHRRGAERLGRLGERDRVGPAGGLIT